MRVLSDELDRLMVVMQAAFDPAYGEAWTRRQVEDALIMGSSHYRIFDEAGEIAGPDAAVAAFTLSRNTGEEEELLLFAVSPEFRRRGIGRRMLHVLNDDARNRGALRIFLEMRRGNTAESLYRTFGFSPIGVRPKYYRFSNGERADAITFAIDID